MIWTDLTAALGSLAVISLMIVCLTVYACVRARVEGEVRRARIACGLPEAEPEEGDWDE